MYIHSNIGRQEPYFAQFNTYNMLGISQPCMIPIRCPPVFCGKEYHELAAAVAALRAKNKAKARAKATSASFPTRDFSPPTRTRQAPQEFDLQSVMSQEFPDDQSEVFDWNQPSD